MPDPIRPRRPLTWRKRLLFSGVLLVLLLALAEVSALVMHRVGRGSWFSWRAMREQRAAIAHPGTVSEIMNQAATEQALHPYLGYVIDPDFRPDPDRPQLRVSEFGYEDEKHPLQRRGPGKCVVAIVGGSVARNFYLGGTTALVEKLRQSERLLGNELIVVNLAMGGYKQPQQLMTINYFLALGAEYDIVVNIDGFNEVALHEAENARWGVFPIFPRSWASRCAAIPDESVQREIRHRDAVGERRRALARNFSLRPICHSVVCNLIWSWRDQVSSRKLQVIENRIRTAATPRTRFLQTGPRVTEFADGDVYRHMVSIWRRSSLQLHHLCQANGIRYYHFLQPNQYVAGSKELNSEERAQAYDEHHDYRPGVEKGYPLLVAEGPNLVQAGVQFVDLTHVFADIGDTVYRDTCCHLNQRGDEILATHIASAILADVGGDLAWHPGAKVR